MPGEGGLGATDQKVKAVSLGTTVLELTLEDV